MVVDQSLTFAARRNIPIRYNREHIATTLTAMKRISEIRARRENRFYKQRMAGKKQTERLANEKLVAENEHLLPRQRTIENETMETLEVPMENIAMNTLEVPMQKETREKRMRQRLLVGGGVENEMDVD